MNKLFTLLVLTVLFTKPLNAQIINDDVGMVLGLTALTIASAIEAQKQYEEDLEYHAINYILDKFPDMKEFSFKVIKTSTGTSNDESNVHIVPFGLTDCTAVKNIGCKRKIVLMHLSSGWVNQFGINFDKIRYYTYGKGEIYDLFSKYLSMLSPVEFDSLSRIPVMVKSKKGAESQNELYDLAGRIWYKSGDYKSFSELYFGTDGLWAKGILSFPFEKLRDGDSYIVDGWNNNFSLVYNERSMGLYNLHTKELSQINYRTLNKIYDFLNEN